MDFDGLRLFRFFLFQTKWLKCTEMTNIKAVSFDMEGTLVTPDFSKAVWYEAIPSLYAKNNYIDFEKAQAIVRNSYEKVGDQRLEWYDIGYWFQHFGLEGYQQLLESKKQRVCHYPEVVQVLSSLNKKYMLIVASSNTREFLPFMLTGIEVYFARVFSSISDYKQLKSPAFYLTVCKEIGIPPQEMIHVGDSWEFDYIAAREAGVQAFYLDRKRGRREKRSIANLTELEAKLMRI